MVDIHDAVVTERPALDGALGTSVWPQLGRLPWISRLRGRLATGDWLILAALAAWTVGPLALQLAYASAHGGAFTGVQTTLSPDYFQYLSWIRDAGTYGLIGNEFLIGPSHPVFLQPMFLISGLLWRLGLSVPLAYLLPWAPVSIALTFFGYRAFVRRHLPSRGQAAAALVLALFFYAPLAVLADRTGHSWGVSIQLPVNLTNSMALWGYFPRAVAVALIPILLLGLELVLTSASAGTERRSLWSLAALAGLAATISWMHPWQGASVLIILLGLTVWNRPSGVTLVWLAVVALAAALPLIYYEALNHYAIYWRLSAQRVAIGNTTFSPLTLALATMPLGALALAGLRRRLPTAPHRQMLLLWVVAPFVVYLLLPGKSAHAFNGELLPLSILAVEGWRRLPWPVWLTRRRLATAIAALAIAACTLPGAESEFAQFHSREYAGVYGVVFSPDDFRAMRYLEHASGAGGVLASPYIAAAVPGFTGRNVFAGEYSWTPNYVRGYDTDLALFMGQLPPSDARAFVAATRARFLLVDCHPHEDFVGPLTPLIAAGHRFGCASVYELRNRA